MRPRILLLNPPVLDFSAFDFWLRPYGVLSVGGRLRRVADLSLFDYMDRRHADIPDDPHCDSDHWGRGRYVTETIPKPPEYAHMPRYYRRYGLPRETFREFLKREDPFDFALIQTSMTYWVNGVREVIADLREISPETRIVLGGVYATLCTEHARGLGVDFVLPGTDLAPLWDYLGLEPDDNGLPYWEGYTRPGNGVLKLADGCPFKCTYCSVPEVYPKFIPRPMERSLAELEHLVSLGVNNIAFYDDALLFNPKRILLPFLEEVKRRGIHVNFHTPNALNARFISPEIARTMVEGGFKTFYLGFESDDYEWQRKTGGKIFRDEFAEAADNLRAAGANPDEIVAYLIIGHPDAGTQNVGESMRFANECGVRVMLSEFSPLPGTPDGEKCREWVDLENPLNHNKLAFTHLRLGDEAIDEIKQLGLELNRRLKRNGERQRMMVADERR